MAAWRLRTGATVRAMGQIRGFLDFTSAVPSARLIARAAYLALGRAIEEA